MKNHANKDPRIKLTFHQKNQHICHASNSALALATGEFIGLLDHDDLISSDALFHVVKCLNQNPQADMIYSDEDKINENKQHTAPFFKPDWCPDSFLTKMYTCHLGIYRKSLVDEIGGFRPGFEGSQDYDFVLRFTEKTNQIFHIDKILYHWRIHAGSTSANTNSKPYAYDAAQKALSEALQRRNEPGIVSGVPGLLGYYQIRYIINKPGLVSIIIPTRDNSEILAQCLNSIFEKTTYSNFEVIVIDNGSIEKETTNLLNSWAQKQTDRFRFLPMDIPFNYSKLNNFAVSRSRGEYLLFLNNDTEVITDDWIEGMLEQAQRESIGAVGALLLYPDDSPIQHAGVVIGLGGAAAHSHRLSSAEQPGYFGQVRTANNYSAVTAACLMCHRSVFKGVGGFEEKVDANYNDVDFCLKLAEKRL